MASIRKRNDYWFIDYSYNGRRYRERIGPDKTTAKTVLRKRLTEIAENRFLDKRVETTLTFKELTDMYMELYSKPNKKSWKNDDLVRVKALNKVFSSYRLDMISPTMIEEYKRKRRGEVSPASVNRELTRLKHLYTKANEWGKTDVNPTKLIRKFRENNSRLRYLTEEEISRLVDTAEGYMRTVIIIALNTGMRKGEILGLRKYDIDYAMGLIYLMDTKNGERRNVVMNSRVSEILKASPPIDESEHLFRDKNGKPVVNIDKKFPKLIESCNIEDFRFHDLRHTFASNLAMKGVDLNMIRELLGHKSISMTLRYSHLSPSHKKKTVEMLAY